MKKLILLAVFIAGPAMAQSQCVECALPTYPEVPPPMVYPEPPAIMSMPTGTVQQAQQATQSAQIQATSTSTTIGGIFRKGAGRAKVNAPECK